MSRTYIRYCSHEDLGYGNVTIIFEEVDEHYNPIAGKGKIRSTVGREKGLKAVNALRTGTYNNFQEAQAVIDRFS